MNLPPRVGGNPRKRDKRLVHVEPAMRNAWCATRPVKIMMMALCMVALLVLLFGVPYIVVKAAQLPWQ